MDSSFSGAKPCYQVHVPAFLLCLARCRGRQAWQAAGPPHSLTASSDVVIASLHVEQLLYLSSFHFNSFESASGVDSRKRPHNSCHFLPQQTHTDNLLKATLPFPAPRSASDTNEEYLTYLLFFSFISDSPTALHDFPIKRQYGFRLGDPSRDGL